MTCTHAALKRHDLVELGFKVSPQLGQVSKGQAGTAVRAKPETERTFLI